MPSKNYLITGASRGIGRGLTWHLLSKGHRIFLLDNNTSELTHLTTKLSKTYKKGLDFETSTCNLRLPSEIQSAIHQSSQFFHGRLDVLVNNAAYTAAVGKSHLPDLTLEDWNASVETNLTAPLLMSQGCLPMLQAAKGCIVNISSTRAVMAEEDNEPYSATKAGLLGLTQSMAVTLAREGVRVNAILPGWIHVGDECKEADEKGTKWEEGLSEEDHKWHLTGRVGKVEDILKAVEYLADAEGVSGTEMIVDGGVTRKMVYPEE